LFVAIAKQDFIISEDIEQYVRELFLTCTELCRFFWACFPLTDKTKLKLARLRAPLQKYQQQLQAARKAFNEEQYGPLVELLTPLELAVEKTFEIQLPEELMESDSPTKQSIPTQKRRKKAKIVHFQHITGLEA